MIEATGKRSRSRFGVMVVATALVAGSLGVVLGASPAGAVGPPNNLIFTNQPGSGTAGSPLTTQPVVTIRDIANVTVPTNSQIFLHITPGSGTAGAQLVGCTANPVTAVNGVATFVGCRVDTVGSGYTLTAEDPADGLAKVSLTFNVQAGTADRLAFTQQPGFGTAGAALSTQPKVAVQDAFGNTRITDNATMVTLALNSGPGVLSGCTGAVLVSAGVATFASCAISLAGTGDTLSAAATGLTTAISAPFNVSDATATTMAFTKQPSSGRPVTALPSFQVAFVDGSGRIVTTATGTITITIRAGSPAGTLSGCTSGVAATNGVATFPNCSINLSGAGFKFRATATAGPVVPVVDSAAFTVGILHLAFISQPGNGTTTSSLSPQPIVALEDANNQIVNSSDPISLSITPSTGTTGAQLTCATNPLPMVFGVAAFALCKVDLPGIGYTITASTSPLGLSASSDAFNVVGPAAQLVFSTQPSDGAAGIPLATQPVVKVEDLAGNVVATDNSTIVTLAKAAATPVSGGPGTLACAAKTAVSGVATFVGCSINQAGVGYKLTATSVPILTTATTNAFDIGGLQRIFGTDAIDTSIAISTREFPVNSSAGAVVLARSDFFSDALAGGPLAAKTGGPLLITPGGTSPTLDPRVQSEIQRVLPTGRTVFILGGPLTLAPGIDTTLTGLGYITVRVAGLNLFGTAVAIANQLGNPSTIFEATGTDFPDALSSVPAAIKTNGAILLTNGATQAPETAFYLSLFQPTTKYAIGGPLAASGADPSATPVFGADLFGTSAAVANTFFPGAAAFGVATGLNYPDALSGGVFMATGGRLGPVLLVNTHVPLPPLIAAYLDALPPTPGYIFGGPLAVGADVEAAIVALFA